MKTENKAVYSGEGNLTPRKKRVFRPSFLPLYTGCRMINRISGKRIQLTGPTRLQQKLLELHRSGVELNLAKAALSPNGVYLPAS
ncbi:hypothetical protein [Acidisphaera sp. S103]|uniref:hypothetical protein n=1 Tax=Acidisphaera sp. S103 TaxID=1747223 RepID=UPI00131CFB81|nr:hypothetical protein [Acidisphaera sp. S103]